MSGNASERVAANGRSLPALTYSIDEDKVANIMLRQEGLCPAFYEAAPAVKHNAAIVAVEVRTHVSSKTPIGCCGAGAVAWARLRSSIPGQKRTASSPAGLASSVILLFALLEDGQWAVGAREESRSGGALSMLRPSDGRPRRDARSHHIVVTRRDLWDPIASILCGCPLRRGEGGRCRVAA